MTHALVETLGSTEGAEWVTSDTIDAFLNKGTNHLSILFFPGVDKQRLETPDVAVVLIELLRCFPASIRVGVVAAEDEKPLMGRAAVLMLPSIAIFCGEKHLETIKKIQDWEVYANTLAKLMAENGIGENA